MRFFTSFNQQLKSSVLVLAVAGMVIGPQSVLADDFGETELDLEALMNLELTVTSASKFE
mgnify:CR=1 FL=1